MSTTKPLIYKEKWKHILTYQTKILKTNSTRYLQPSSCQKTEKMLAAQREIEKKKKRPNKKKKRRRENGQTMISGGGKLINRGGKIKIKWRKLKIS